MKELTGYKDITGVDIYDGDYVTGCFIDKEKKVTQSIAGRVVWDKSIVYKFDEPIWADQFLPWYVVGELFGPIWLDDVYDLRKEDRTRKAKAVIISTNGNTMVFDDDGNQMVKYQGFILEVAQKLIAICDTHTEFSFAKRGDWEEPAQFDWFFEKD